MDPVLLALLKKYVDVPGLFSALLEQKLLPALQKAVKATATPLDDIALSALYPLVAAELNKDVAGFWAGIGVSAPSAPASPSAPSGNPV